MSDELDKPRVTIYGGRGWTTAKSQDIRLIVNGFVVPFRKMEISIGPNRRDPVIATVELPIDELHLDGIELVTKREEKKDEGNTEADR